MHPPKLLASLVSLLCVFSIPAAYAFTSKPAEAKKYDRQLVKKFAANTDQQTKDYVLFSKQILSGK